MARKMSLKASSMGHGQCFGFPEGYLTLLKIWTSAAAFTSFANVGVSQTYAAPSS